MKPTDMRGSVAPGTVVLVTGGARGVGAELSRSLGGRFLCSSGSGSTTGQTLVVDGGVTFS